MHLVLSTHNTEFLALALGALNLVEWNSCCASGRPFGSQHCCFGSADGDHSFYGQTFDVSSSTLLISFENQT